MNMKKWIAVFLAAVLLASVLAGCSGKNASMDYAENEMPMDNGALADGIYESSSSTSQKPVSDRKLIRKIYLDTETEDLDNLLGAIDSKVAALGGYMESREVYTGSAYSSYSVNRRADLVIRIPKDRMDEFVSHVEEFSNVTSTSETSEDVTLSYVATQSRMTALRKEEERLLALIDQAANLTELLELEKRLTEVRTELEQVTSQLLLYDNLVDYATVSVSIQEVQKLTPVAEPSFWQRISTGFMESLSNLWTFLKELAIFLIVSLPYFLPLAFVVILIVTIIRMSIRKKRKAKRQPPFQSENKE